MPRRFQPFAAPDGIEKLNTRPLPMRLEFVERLQSAIAANPTEAQIVGRGMGSGARTNG